MSLRGAADRRTICEVLREINDILQNHHVLHREILPKLVEAEAMAKRMAKKLYEYNKDFDKDWWGKNKDVAAKLEKRMDTRYVA